MSNHYNAFISYRHTPHDSKIAETIQKQLERFKIPGSIKKSHGIKKIDRIFRDKEELPITSNLNETIENALNNSDHLIVICSHAMLESIWVQREINFFLKTHTKKQILTVIAEGEPVDVLPEILKTDEVEITNEDGSKEMITIPAEPLSCDYRLPLNKAKREELPRLAAALIGCSYDSLRQRQRQYRMRRLAIAGTASAAAMVGLTSYFAWSAAQIQENYIASLKNQSAYLSAEANRLYDNGDRLSAMLLALEALPSEDADRPVIPEAVDAIVRSTYAYQYPGSNARILDTSYSHKGAVNKFDFDSTNRYMYVQHSRYSLSFWDTETHEEFFSKSYTDSIDGIIITPDDNLLVWNWDMIECLDGKTGETLWSYNDYVSSAVLHEESGRIAIDHHNIGEDYLSELQVLDSKTGEVLYSMPQDIIINDVSWDLYPISFNTAGNIVAVQLYQISSDTIQIGIWNLENNSFVYAPTDVSTIELGTFMDNNTFISISPINTPYSMDGYSFISIAKGMEYYILGNTSMLIQCFDTDMNLLWSTKHPYALLYNGSTIDTLEYPDGDTNIPAFIYSIGNRSAVYNIETGELLNSITSSDTIVHSIYMDGICTYFLKNGMCGGWNLSSNLYSEMSSTISNVGAAYYSDRLYVCEEDSHQILSYKKKLYDKNWETIEALPTSDKMYYTPNGTLIISDTRKGDEDTLLISFLNANGIQWQKELDRYYYHYSFIGADEKNIILSYDGTDKDGNSIHYLEYWNIETGEVVTKDFSQMFGSLSSNLWYVNGNYICKDDYTNESSSDITRYVLADSEFNIISEFFVSDNELDTASIPSTILSVNPNGSSMLLKGNDGVLLLLSQNACVPLFTTDEYSIMHGWDKDNNLIAIARDNVIQVFDKNGTLQYEISNDGRNPLSIQFYEEYILVAYENRVLRRYSISDGSYLSETELKTGSLATIGNTVWEFSEDELWLIIDEKLNIIDTTTWKPETTVDNCFGFDIQNQTLFLTGWEEGKHEPDEKCIGILKRYTVNELIERAKEQLGTVDLTEEQKAQYGLS